MASKVVYPIWRQRFEVQNQGRHCLLSAHCEPDKLADFFDGRQLEADDVVEVVDDFLQRAFCDLKVACKLERIELSKTFRGARACGIRRATKLGP
jgi:hypothetical protein